MRLDGRAAPLRTRPMSEEEKEQQKEFAGSRRAFLEVNPTFDMNARRTGRTTRMVRALGMSLVFGRGVVVVVAHQSMCRWMQDLIRDKWPGAPAHSIRVVSANLVGYRLDWDRLKMRGEDVDVFVDHAALQCLFEKRFHPWTLKMGEEFVRYEVD